MRAVIGLSLIVFVSSLRNQKRNDTGIYIVNGQPAPQCKWKHQINLGGCGGTIIDTNWVLSAGHCFRKGQSPSSIRVKAGAWDLRKQNNVQNKTGSRLYIHPRYKGASSGYDVALIKLSSSLSFNSCVDKANLPSSAIQSGSTCWISGWGTLSSGGGVPTVLQEVEVKIISNSACTRSPFKYGSGQITSSMICAQGRRNGRPTDACQGDSGGPLVCSKSGKWVVYGATSWGRGCADSSYPGVWSNVYGEMSWIRSTMGGSSPSPSPSPSPSRRRTRRRRN